MSPLFWLWLAAMFVGVYLGLIVVFYFNFYFSQASLSKTHSRLFYISFQ